MNLVKIGSTISIGGEQALVLAITNERVVGPQVVIKSETGETFNFSLKEIEAQLK